MLRQKSLRLFEITPFRFINARRELIKLWIEIRFGDLIDTLHSLMIFNVVESHLNSHYREAFLRCEAFLFGHWCFPKATISNY